MMDCDEDKIYKYLGKYTGLGTQDFGSVQSSKS